MQTSSQWRHYVQQGQTIENQFFIYGPKCNLVLYLSIWRGLQWLDLACVAFQLSSHPYLCTCEIRKQSDKNFLSSNPKYETNIYFFIFGGSWGPLRQTQGYQIFRTVRPHQRADKCITREQNNHQFFIYGPQCDFFACLAILAILSPIYMYMWNKEAIWWELSTFKSKIWNKYLFFHIWGVLGALLRQTQGYQIFRTVRPHHRADKCITREQNNHKFFIYGPQCDFFACLAILAILSPISMYMWNKEAIWWELSMFKSKIWNKYLFFHIWGVLGALLRQTQGYQIFITVRPHHRADKCITREQNNHKFFIYGPQCDFFCIFGYSGGGGGLGCP